MHDGEEDRFAHAQDPDHSHPGPRVADRYHDYVDGRADLDRRLIRCVGDPGARFTEDHLRMLRAARFAATLDFTIAPATEAAIREQARYIAIDAKSPLNATRWLERIHAAANTLATWPRRCALAEEDAHRPYEIRKLSVDGYLLLFTIEDATNTVWIIATRHARTSCVPALASMSAFRSLATSRWSPQNTYSGR